MLKTSAQEFFYPDGQFALSTQFITKLSCSSPTNVVP